MAENLTNGAQTTLNGAINNSQTTATLTSASGWPAAPFRALISAEGGNTDEIIYVGAISGTSLTNITRAAEPIADGTQVAQAHSSGAIITQVLTRVGLINQGLNTGTIGALAKPSTNTTAGTGSYAALNIFDQEVYDTDGFHTASPNSRFTIPAGLSGKYLLVLKTYCLSGSGYVAIHQNGATYIGYDETSGSSAMAEIVLVVDAVAGDYFDAETSSSSNSWQADGSSYSITKLDSGKVGTGVGAKAYNSGTQSIPNSTYTALTLDSERWDTDGFHSTSSNTSRMTIPAGLAGKYLVTASSQSASNGTADRYITFYVNGVNVGPQTWSPGSTSTTEPQTTGILNLVGGDYVEAYVFQNSGGSLNYGDATNAYVQSSLSIMRLDSSASTVNATANFAIPPLDRTTVTGMDTTYGDDFTESALNARWTRQTQGSGEESYQQGPRQSALAVAYSTGAASRYIYQALATTIWTFETSLTVYQPIGSNQMFGIMALDSSQNGVGIMLYDNSQGLYLANIASGSFSSSISNTGYLVSEHRAGQRYWLRLRAASGTFYASYSFDGEIYSPELSGTPSAFTIARIGIGRFLGTQSGDTAYWHWFDKTA